MAYDTVLAERAVHLLAPLTAFEERKMFGGLAFMVNTHMACGIVRDDLMVRVGKPLTTLPSHAVRRRWTSPDTRCAAW
jgi:TfoX/Sxy family transcriptional regulator of competence genes